VKNKNRKGRGGEGEKKPTKKWLARVMRENSGAAPYWGNAFFQDKYRPHDPEKGWRPPPRKEGTEEKERIPKRVIKKKGVDVKVTQSAKYWMSPQGARVKA